MESKQPQMRTESDLLGSVEVPCDVLYGVQSAGAGFGLDPFGMATHVLVLRFITGIGVGGTLPVDYTMMAEFLPPRNRGRWLAGGRAGRMSSDAAASSGSAGPGAGVA